MRAFRTQEKILIMVQLQEIDCQRDAGTVIDFAGDAYLLQR
jgi:hypothetical protein